MNRDDIFAVTQSVIAVIVILGGGIAILAQSPNVESVVGIIGVVIGYYFRGMTTTVTASASRARKEST